MRQSDRPALTQVRLKEALSYDPVTGVFMWLRVKSKKRAFLMRRPAGTINSDGYRIICIDGVQHLAHRLAWLYMTGDLKGAKEIDHRDRDTGNNAWSNLRLATRAQNVINRDVVRSSTTGVTGVSRSGRGYRAYITVGGQNIHLGCRATIAEAAALRSEAAIRYFGEFAESA